ncbi:membrane protein involved in the export of O-antigen and teichoic acid [Rivularia sp. PCC 7116]|uniref:lipopolysaccharide biosynthesis protein n=1 Tax=Rivularia sp. PCC 7116 TaxID=373994 RepID=UPI00029F1122|nr:lipopolysaccharide biosynthesis protein [Rivularia sp. PCC 7116]AFY59213.1 membrane protein involved in the export of O-antigen and teichoic acid [Rivularia sp. PCC 7116]
MKNYRHLNTDNLRADLKRRSLLSGLISFAAQPIKLALGIGSTAILARILTPADFGLVAMVAPLLSLADSLSNFGLETATVQREELDNQQLSASFWLSLKINAVVVALMVIMAWILANFYGEEELIGITLLITLGFAAVCLTFVHKSLLKRQMRFGILTTIEVVSLILAAAIAIVAAYEGWGYLALVLQLVVMQLVQSIGYLIICPWLPEKQIKKHTNNHRDSNLQAILSYGAHLTGFRFLMRIGMQLDRILIGYLSGATALGFYQVAYKWSYFPFQQVYFSLFDVAVSSFSRTLHDQNLYRSYCRKVLMLLFGLCMPALAFSFVEARKLLLLLLGNQWLEAVPLFRVLCIAVFVGSMYRVTKWLYISAGQTQQQFRWGLIHTPVVILAVVIGSQWGAFGVGAGYTTAICLLTYPSVAFCLKTSPLTATDFLTAVSCPAFSSISAAFVLYLCKQFLLSFDNLIVNLFVSLIIFSIIYICFWFVFPGGRQSAAEVLLNIKQLRHKSN